MHLSDGTSTPSIRCIETDVYYLSAILQITRYNMDNIDSSESDFTGIAFYMFW